MIVFLTFSNMLTNPFYKHKSYFFSNALQSIKDPSIPCWPLRIEGLTNPVTLDTRKEGNMNLIQPKHVKQIYTHKSRCLSNKQKDQIFQSSWFSKLFDYSESGTNM